MSEKRAMLFRGRHLRDEIIVPCLRRYLRYPLSHRNLEEMITERGLELDHSTIARRVLRYAGRAPRANSFANAKTGPIVASG